MKSCAQHGRWTASQPDSDAVIDLDVRGTPITFCWGSHSAFGTAAFWIDQTRRSHYESLRLGRTLAEEVAACIIGGYGVQADIAFAAFQAVQSKGLLCYPLREQEIALVLSGPHSVTGRSRPVSYRFAHQRARRLVRALEALDEDVPIDPFELREWLQRLEGIGPKTASWITRNVTDAEIAVIDIHIERAGVAAGFFSRSWNLPRDYHKYEIAFVAVANLGGVHASDLDNRIWKTLAGGGAAADVILTAPTLSAYR